MTIRRYYHDATTTQFAASIVETLTHDGRPGLILEQTYFYPTSGGQPHDTGQVWDGECSARVVDVVAAAPDAPVVHLLDAPWTGGVDISLEIDWPRRFDHMQQHTGQHILSQAFIRVAQAETVSFHLSDQTVTIDLDTFGLTAEHLTAVEQMANEVIWRNQPVTIQVVSLGEAQQLPLRKLPTKHDGQLRLIAIGDFDLTACGGTHVAATGQVGLIKLVKTERRGDQTRVEFCCGGRALDDYRRKNAITAELVTMLTTGHDDLVTAVGRLQDDTQHWRSVAAGRQKALLGYEAEQLVQQAVSVDGQRLVLAVLDDGEPDALRLLANRLIETDRLIALLALRGERTHFVFGRSADATGHMGDILRSALPALEGAKGGGSATMAQGSGPAADRVTVEGVLSQARQQLPTGAKPVE